MISEWHYILNRYSHNRWLVIKTRSTKRVFVRMRADNHDTGRVYASLQWNRLIFQFGFYSPVAFMAIGTWSTLALTIAERSTRQPSQRLPSDITSVSAFPFFLQVLLFWSVDSRVYIQNDTRSEQPPVQMILQFRSDLSWAPCAPRHLRDQLSNCEISTLNK